MSGVIQAIDDQLFKHQDLQNKKVCLVTVLASGSSQDPNRTSRDFKVPVSHLGIRPLNEANEELDSSV